MSLIYIGRGKILLQRIVHVYKPYLCVINEIGKNCYKVLGYLLFKASASTFINLTHKSIWWMGEGDAIPYTGVK